MSKKKADKTNDSYSVVKFKERGLKLFECIPDLWFVDNEKIACYWPPKGKSFRLRALNKQEPDSSWSISECVFVSGGYVTYNDGLFAAKKKVDDFNTSSADDHLDALNFQRKHPVLALSANSNFEHLFPPQSSDNVESAGVRDVIESERSEVRKPACVQKCKPKSKQDGIEVRENVFANNEEEITTRLSTSSSRHSRALDVDSPENLSLRTGSRSRGPSSEKSHFHSASRDSYTSGSESSSTSSAARHSTLRSDRSRSRQSKSCSRSSSRYNSRSKSSDSKSNGGRSVTMRSRSRSISNSSSSIHRSQHSSRSTRFNISHSRSPSPAKRQANNSRRISRSHSSGDTFNLQPTDPRSIAAFDRRMTRMEVTINKIFVMVSDIIKHSNKESRSQKQNHASVASIDRRVPSRFVIPDLPICGTKDLSVFSKMLKRKEVYSFMLEQEKDFCAPSKSSDNVVMTAYLKRFISLELRCEIALKDTKGQKELTLFDDFRRVYNFLIDVMKSGYAAYNKRVKSTEVHTALRTVWGRSNQLLQEEQRKMLGRSKKKPQSQKKHRNEKKRENKESRGKFK